MGMGFTPTWLRQVSLPCFTKHKVWPLVIRENDVIHEVKSHKVSEMNSPALI